MHRGRRRGRFGGGLRFFRNRFRLRRNCNRLWLGRNDRRCFNRRRGNRSYRDWCRNWRRGRLCRLRFIFIEFEARPAIQHSAQGSRSQEALFALRIGRSARLNRRSGFRLAIGSLGDR